MLEFVKGLFDIFRHLKYDSTLHIAPLQTNADIYFQLFYQL